MTKQTIVDYWKKTAQEDVKTAEALLGTKRYLPCLFFCHLFLEKIAKGLYIANKDDSPPYSHDVIKILNQADLSVPTDIADAIHEINRFNIQARYDDYKFSLYKEATQLFTKAWFEKAKEIYVWLEKQF